MEIYNSSDIYFYRKNLPNLDIFKIFELKQKDKYLKIENKNISCVLKNINIEIFEKTYNEFYRSLNLDFKPRKIKNKIFSLNEEEIEALMEEIIIHWMFYYTVNNLKIKIIRDDFIHSQTKWIVYNFLQKKYGKETNEILKFGSKIMRLDLKEYKLSIESTKCYMEYM